MRNFKNILKLKQDTPIGEYKEDLFTNILDNSTPLPKPIEYKDIDIAFKQWVEEGLYISFEGKELPTVALFSNQRFSEYMQSWENVDENQNMMLNFKVITRENNPQQGTMQGGNMNIPGDISFLMKRVPMVDKNGRQYFLDYRMKQPLYVDLNYTVNVVTNKYTLLNKFNQLVLDKFKAIQCYIAPNGHLMPMKLENVSDESEYNINDRQFFSQAFEITVMGYILTENDYLVEERPVLRFSCCAPGEKQNNSKVELEESEEIICPPYNPYRYQKVTLTVDFEPCEENVEFKLPIDFNTIEIEKKNLISYKIYCNKELVEGDELQFKKNDKVNITYAKKKALIDKQTMKPIGSQIIFNGYNPSQVFDERQDNPESELDRTQFDLDIEINK